MKKSILFFLFFPILALSSPWHNNIDTIIQKTNLDGPMKEGLINDFYKLIHKKTIYRKISKPIPLSSDLLYQLSLDLPLCAKLINISRNKDEYLIEPITRNTYKALDRDELEGEISLLINKKGKMLFYGKGTVHFAFNDYEFIGYMFVDYYEIDSKTSTFSSEISIYPSNFFTRSLLSFLMKIGFSNFVDKKIDNIYKTINKTAQRMVHNQYVFHRAFRSDSLKNKYKINKEDIESTTLIFNKIKGLYNEKN